MQVAIQDRDGNIHPFTVEALHTLIITISNRTYHLREIDGELQFEAINAPLVLVPTGHGRVRVRREST